jgi:hypothetical protein
MPKLSDAALSQRIRDETPICRACAEDEYGAAWPPGHEATGFYGKCGFCGKEKALNCSTDWSWPKLGYKINFRISLGREP